MKGYKFGYITRKVVRHILGSKIRRRTKYHCLRDALKRSKHHYCNHHGNHKHNKFRRRKCKLNKCFAAGVIRGLKGKKYNSIYLSNLKKNRDRKMKKTIDHLKRIYKIPLA